MFGVYHHQSTDPPSIEENVYEEALKTFMSGYEANVMSKCRFEYDKNLILKQAVCNTLDGTEPFTNYQDMTDKAQTRISLKPPYMFITVNPRSSITYEVLKKQVDKFVSKKFVEAYYGCYEIRDGDFNGLHVHLLIKYKGQCYNTVRSCKTMFKNVCDISNTACLNIKYIQDELLQSKVDYIAGKKQEKKLGTVSLCNVWKKDRFFGESALLVGLPQLHIEEAGGTDLNPPPLGLN